MLRAAIYFLLVGLNLLSANVLAEKDFKVVGYQKFNTIDNFEPKAYENLDQLVYKLIRVKANGDLDLLPNVSSDLNLLQNKKKAFSSTSLLIGVGGAKKNSKHFAQMASNTHSINRFAIQLLEFCLEHGLNGADIDWEYPKSHQEKKHAIELFKTLKRKFEPYKLKITAAVNYAPGQMEFGKSIEQYVDQINLMVYEPMDGLKTFQEQIDFALKLAEEKRLDKSKIVVGLPFYGKNLKTGKAMPYKKIIQLNTKNKLSNDIHFLGPKDIKFYTKKFRESGFYGVMFWELGFDVDLSSNDSLLKAINDATH